MGEHRRLLTEAALSCPGDTQACVTELQRRSSSKLPGYELVTGASLGMSVPWSACVMPAEVSGRQREGGRGSKCFLDPGLGSPAGRHDPKDYKQPAVVRNYKVQTRVQHAVQPDLTAATAQTLCQLGLWALIAEKVLPPPGPGSG